MNTALLKRPEVDLRRREIRDLSETILRRAEHALPEDQTLIRAAYQEGLTATDIAKLRRRPARTVRRQLRELVSNLLSPQFAFVMRERKNWPKRRRLVATSCILQKRSFRETAHHLKVSMYAVRTEIAVVNALFASESREQTEGRNSSC